MFDLQNQDQFVTDRHHVQACQLHGFVAGSLVATHLAGTRSRR